MRLSTANNYVTVVLSQLDSQFRSALFYHPNVAELSQQFNAIITGQPFYTSLPQWAKTRLWVYRGELLNVSTGITSSSSIVCLTAGR